MSVLSNAQSAQADENEAVSNSSIETTASGTEALVEETVVATNETVNPVATLETATTAVEISSTSELSLANSEVSTTSISSQATPQSTSSSEQITKQASQAASTSENHLSNTNTLALRSQEVSVQPVAVASRAVMSQAATSSEVTSSETVITSESHQVDAQGQVTAIPLAALEQMLPSRSFARLMNSINAAAAERNRGQRGQAGTSGFRASFSNTEGLHDKLAGVTTRVVSGYFVDTKYVDDLKIGFDPDGMPWIYDYKVTNPTYIDPRTGNTEPRTRFEAIVSLQKLGTIDFVDEDGKGIPNITDEVTFNQPTDSISVDGKTYPNIFDVSPTKIPTIPSGYRLKTVDGDPTKVVAYVDILEKTATYDFKDLTTTEDVTDENYIAPPAPKLSDPVWKNNQKQTVTLIQNADGSFSLDPSVDAVGSTLAPGYKYHLVLEADETPITQVTSQTITYTGADNNPSPHVDNSFTFTGKENAVTHAKTWDSTSHQYGRVNTPVISGYYADKATAGGLTVTPDAPNVTDTVSYKPLGKLIFVDEAGNQIPNTTAITFNNSGDPTKASETEVPSLPSGYEIKDGQNLPVVTMRDGSRVALPTDPGTDIRIVLRNGQELLTQATSQTVHFTGAGSATPADEVQDNFTFSGTRDKVTGTKTWNQANHTYDSVAVPVIPGYFADKATAGGQTVTPDAPAATDTVTYSKLGKIIPVDEAGNPIPGANTLVYVNDPSDPTKGGVTTVPSIPGYTPKVVSVTPGNPGSDTSVIYVPNIDDVTKGTKQTVSYTGAGSDTPADDVQDDYSFQGKYNQVDQTTTWTDTSHTYGTVKVPVVTGYYADKATAGGKTVTPDAPNATDTVTYSKLGKIILVDEAGQPVPDTEAVVYTNDSQDPTKATATIIPSLPKGYTLKPGQSVDMDRSAITVTPIDLSRDTFLTIVPRLTKATQTTSQTVVFQGAGRATPAQQTFDDFSFIGTKNEVTGAIDWTDTSHAYGTVKVPVVTGYYADKATAGGQTVTPDAPEATDTVTYASLGKIILVDEAGQQITGTATVVYNNDMNDATKVIATALPSLPNGYQIKAGQTVAGFNATDNTVTASSLGQDTLIVLVAKVGAISQAAKQTVSYTGAGSETPADKVQNFTFTGSENAVTGNKDWDQASHDFAIETVPVIQGYYADKATAGGKTVTPDAPNVTDTVTYSKLGKIIPVDEAGNPIPGADTPVYVNDPSDPTKGGETGVPTIPGYTPNVLTVIPGQPGSDTTVVYIRDTQKAIILYVNESGNTELAKAEVIGKSEEAINYSTEDQIATLKRQGYELVSDGFATASDKTFDLDKTVDQSFTVVLRERVVPVDPAGPNPKAGDTVDPSDPDSPKWPTSVFALDNHDDVTRTVAYVYENGRQAANDVVETLHFQRLAHVNLVTGAISYDAWTTSKDNFEAVKTPNIPGYTADQTQVASETGVLAGTADSRVLVTYAKDIQKVTVSYIDQTTGQILTNDSLTGKSGDLISYSTTDKIKDYQDKGYVLVSVDFPSNANFDLDQTVDQHFTVTFKHDTAVTTETKATTAIVRYISTDDKANLPVEKVQTAQWTRTVTHDKVTGEVLNQTAWTADKETYDAVATPVVTGYFADQAQVAAQAVTESDIETVVTYTPFGKIIPVDANGHLIPGADTPIYVNDPTDPTKALVTNVPTVPGYKTETRQVTPTDPSQDTKVVYIRDVPTNPVTPQPTEDSYIVIEYRDEAGNKIRPDRIISSRYGANYDVSDGDQYINRNGVWYEKIRQENTTGKAGKGRTTVTYIYRRVDDPAPAGVGTNTTTRSQESTARPSKDQEAKAANQTTEELPVTGEASSAMTGLGAFLLSLLAFLGFRPKKKQED